MRSLRFGVIALLILALIAGCTAIAKLSWAERYGEPLPPARVIDVPLAQYDEPEYYRDIKPIFEKRCIACHGCYDAPCQLKLTSFPGIERGASPIKVYDGTRLIAENLTRLFIDAQSADEWRQKDFYPVLNEYRQDASTNLAASSLYKMLELKREHPLPSSGPLPSTFDFSLDRAQACARVEVFDEFAKKFPQWGMPYGMPAIEEPYFQTIKRWLETGAKVAARPALSSDLQHVVAEWEQFFNGDDLKTQLMSRYIYEHLYLGDLFFSEIESSDIKNSGVDDAQFFKLVRSRTPPGQLASEIPSRRPFDDPLVTRVYYRLLPVYSSMLVKSHMPYALDTARMGKWQEWFQRDVGTITSLPSYEPAMASNPFKSFQDIPVRSRYRFLLDEAQFTIMGFIKGPVCRGQVALNVINDQFWVVFINPDLPEVAQEGELLKRERDDLRLPAEAESNAVPVNWRAYSQAETRYLEKKNAFLQQVLAKYPGASLEHIWNGDGRNKNAALTVFRHFDSATVAQGFVGEPPKTAWVVGYALLERIHYLLVAGYDVYGNVGHQLMTRMYMDFLRMEGEANFIEFLPKSVRMQERQFWYRNVSDDVAQYVYSPRFELQRETAIQYQTDKPKQEFYEDLRRHLGPAMSQRWVASADGTDDLPTRAALQRLQQLQGEALAQLPQLSIVSIRDGDQRRWFTMVHNTGHANVSTLLFESREILHDEDTLSFVPGILGAYPNMFFDVDVARLPAFAAALEKLGSADDYTQLVDTFGVRRNAPNFWAYSDEVQEQVRVQAPIEAGVLDYNRFENR